MESSDQKKEQPQQQAATQEQADQKKYLDEATGEMVSKK